MATDKEEKVRREVTQEDLDLNPGLAKKGVKIGDVHLLPPIVTDNEDEEDEDSDGDLENDESDDEEDSSDEDSEEEEKTDPSNVPISFKIRNPNNKSGFSVRTFSKAEHGKNYKKIASDFEAANTHMKVVDMTDKEAIQEAYTHNRDIKHPIIVEKKSE